ncbi:MAG: hypothetical protein ACLTZB_03600 [Streptococcus salivarius]
MTGISFETDKIGLAYFDKETNRTIYHARKRYRYLIFMEAAFTNGNLISWTFIT